MKKLDDPVPEHFFNVSHCCPTNERQNVTSKKKNLKLGEKRKF